MIDYTMQDKKIRFFIDLAFFLATQNDCTIFDKGLHSVYLNKKGMEKSVLWNKIRLLETKAVLTSINQKWTENTTDHFQQQSRQKAKRQ